MKLTKTAIQILKGNRSLKTKAALAAGVPESTIYGWVRVEGDGDAKLAVLECLERETGLTREQLVERETKVIHENP